MIAIPAATFQLGCAPSRDPSCAPTELPQHAVSVKGFRIDRTEVTQAEYALCVDAHRCSPPAADFDPRQNPKRPVTEVTWEQARTYCASLRKRLPSEAEWELAARGTDGRIFPWGDDSPTCERAHTTACGATPGDVGARTGGASPYGVLDMAGNVDEWVDDVYASYSGTVSAAGERVARGGAYDAWHSRATARSALAPTFHDALLGFRCAAE
jgi:formylglycine-generating enzyme required for sulfatase activity